MRITFAADPDPRVIRGESFMTKDGEPLQLYSYTEGLLGPIT